MQIHSLGFNDFEQEEYSLIGIHTALEDYKLAYLLNRSLGINFQKFKEDIEFKQNKTNASFSLYKYKSIDYEDDVWFLIANSSVSENQTKLKELLLTTEIKSFLIPEKKKIDFFIKITGTTDNDFVSETIEKIKKIDQIITSYSIDKDTLKSKDFLIF